MNIKTRTVIRCNVVYHEIARRLQLKQGYEDIAQATGLKLETVRSIVTRKSFKEVMEQVHNRTYKDLDRQLTAEARDLHAEISEQAAASFDRLKLLMVTSPSEQIQMKIAHDFLDRAGISEKTNKSEQTVNININAIDAEVLKTALDNEQRGIINLQKKDVKDLAPQTEELDHPSKRRELEYRSGNVTGNSKGQSA